MKPRITLFQAGLRLIYEWLFSVLCSYFIIIIFMGKKPDGFIEFALLIIYLASYWIRKRAGYNIWIFAVHAVLLVSVILLPFSASTKWVLSGIIIYQFSEALVYEKRGNFVNFSDVPWPTFFVSVVIYAYGYATKSSLLTSGAYIIPIILIVLYLLIIYIDGLDIYLESTKNVSGLPVKKIVFVNSSIVIAIIILLLAGILLGRALGLSSALYKGLKAVVFLLSYVIFAIRLMFIFLLRPLTKTTSEKMQYEQNKFGDFLSDHADDTVGILDMIYKTAAILLVIYILYKLAGFIIKLLMKKRTVYGDKVEEAVVSKRRIDVTRIKKEKKNIFSSEYKFRKLYRERVLRYKYDIRLDACKTGRDIRDELYKNELDDITKITAAYEEVRYGDKKVTKEMMKLFDRFTE